MQEMQRTRVQSLGQEDPLEVEMTTHSSILAWRISWTEEPGGLQPMGSQGVRHDWASGRTTCQSPHTITTLSQSLSLSPPWAPTPDTAVEEHWGPGGGKTPAGMESQAATHIQTSWALSRLYHTSSSQKGPSITPHKMPAHPLIIHLYLKWSNFQSLCFLSFKLQLSHLLSFNQ